LFFLFIKPNGHSWVRIFHLQPDVNQVSAQRFTLAADA